MTGGVRAGMVLAVRSDGGTRTVVALAALVVVVAGLRLAASFCLPVVTALLLAVISAPMVKLLARRAGMRPSLAILLTLALDMGVLVALAALLAGSFSGFEQKIPVYQEQFRPRLEELLGALRRLGLAVDASAFDPFRDATALMDVVSEVLRALTQFVSNALLVVLLLAFMLFEMRPLTEKLTLMLGRKNPQRARLTRAVRELQRYLVIKTWLSLLTGLLSGLWLAACGVDYPLLWGLLTFFANYIPSVGPAIALVPPFLIAWLSHDLRTAGAVAAGYSLIAAGIGNVIEPRTLGRRLGLSMLAIFVSMLFWGWLWGPVGALFAVPLTMMLRAGLEIDESTRWIAVLIGSTEYVEQRRAEWGWRPIEESDEAPAATPKRRLDDEG